MILEYTLLELYEAFQQDISSRIKSRIDRPYCNIGALTDMNIATWAIFEPYHLLYNYKDVWDPEVLIESKFYGAYLNYASFQTLLTLLCI